MTDEVVKGLKQLPSVKEKPFKLPEIYIAEGYDTIEGEDGNVGFGVYVPDENQIYVAGDVEDEIRARALFHEIGHWVQAMCGRPFNEDEANEFSDIVYNALPSAQPEQLWIPCSERLPKEKDAGILKKLGTGKRSEYVLATVEVKGERMTVTACTYDGKWDWNMKYAFPDFKVIAWMPLPDPYGGTE